MGGAVFPPCSFVWGHTMAGVMAVTVTSFERTYARTFVFSAPGPTAEHTPPLESPWHSQAGLGQCLLGSLLLFPGSWCAQGFVCAIQESISPVLWKFCNQISVASESQIPWRFSMSLPDPQVGKSLVGPRTFATVQEILWYNWSPVCGLSAQWLCSGANMLFLSGLLQPKPLSLRQATADLCLCRKHSTLKGRSGLVSCRFPASCSAQGCYLSPPSISGGYGVQF